MRKTALQCSIRNTTQSAALGHSVSFDRHLDVPELLTTCSEKNELIEEAHRTIKIIKQMEASLEDQIPNDAYKLANEEPKVTVPLTRCLQGLKEKHNTIAKIHRERLEQVTSKISINLEESALMHCRTRTGARVLLFPP